MENVIKANTNKPIYDEKVKATIEGLTKGKSLNEIALAMNYGNTKSLDIYMRRKNFRYNKATENYEPIKPEREGTIIELPTSSRVSKAIQLLSMEGADSKATAKKLGFKDNIGLANFMKINGYEYDVEKRNYVKKTGEIKENHEIGYEKSSNIELSNDNDNDKNRENIQQDKNAIETFLHSEHIEEYQSILEMLRKNQDKLVDFLMPEIQNGKIPRFVVGGTFVTKSVHMSNLLDEMVREFSMEKNISQREIFEVALIEFFRKYGYESAVETMLSR